MTDQSIGDELFQIPDQWKNLDVSQWSGSILLLGGVDTGKSTFGRYLLHRLLESHKRVAYLDGDLGQQEIAPPAAIGLSIGENSSNEAAQETAFSPGEGTHFRFVGSNTPRGHFLPLLLGMHKLQELAVDEGAAAIVVNTSGFINPMQGAAVLKWSKIELLKPSIVVAFQRQREMEPILAPLRRLMGSSFCPLVPAPEAVSKTAEDRKSYRSQRYRDYFQDSQSVGLSYKQLAVFPNRTFYPGQLIGLEDAEGFTLSLGLVEKIDTDDQALWIKTPWWGEKKVTSLRLGSFKLDPESYLEEPLSEQP